LLFSCQNIEISKKSSNIVPDKPYLTVENNTKYMMLYNRREFIKTAGLLYGSLLLLPGCSSTGKKYMVFADEEAGCLIALCERIIPADDYPGATDAGVIHFIDKQVHLRFPEEKELFRKGIESLQIWCRTKYNRNFEELSVELQNNILQMIEKNEMPQDLWSIPPRQFFNKLLDRTMQGFYGSPRHGGNKNYMSFKMLKLDYPLLIGQNRYRK